MSVMGGDFWLRVDEIVAHAIDLPEPDRLDYVRQHSGGDADVEREAITQLGRESSGEAFLGSLARRLGIDAPAALDETVADEARSSHPQKIGAYRVERMLGRGGMGVVYLGQRDDEQFSQRVAIKLLPVGVGSETVDRFLAERRILARLQHDAIAQLFDGGLTDDRSPYFVMGYVDGTPIDSYCDQHELSIEQRLELFEQVCDAVAYAHRSLVVHRDLKPANILVTRDGKPKLLDFGIAKLLDPEQTGFLETQRGTPLTPAFASPEQISGAPISTATDVYALGVLLSVLLSDRFPYAKRPEGIAELQTLICEQDALAPSAQAKRHGDAERAAGVRGLSTDRWASRLEGDLDAIVLQALRKEPDQRYASATALAQDVRRHLDCRPVEARPLTWTYSMGRLIARHRTTVTLLSALVVALVVFAVTGSWLARRAQIQADQAALERDRSERVVDLLVDVFEVSDPDRLEGSNVSAAQLLNWGTAQVEQTLDEDPLVRSTLLESLGRMQLQLGNDEEAARLLVDALEIRRTGGEPLDVARTAHLLGLARAGQREMALAVERQSEAIDLFEALPDTSRAELGDAYVELGSAQSHLSMLDEAEENIVRGRDLLIDELGPVDARSMQATYELANLRHQQGDYDGARTLWEEAVASMREHDAPDTKIFSDILASLGSYYDVVGQDERALDVLGQAHAIRQKLFGDEHPEAAFMLSRIGGVRGDLGDLEQAERDLRGAMEILRAHGRESDSTSTWIKLARILGRTGRHAEGVEIIAEAIAVDTQINPDNTSLIAGHYKTYGELLAVSGRLDEAVAAFEKAGVLIVDAYGDSSPLLFDIEAMLGTMSLARQRLDEGIRRLEQAVEHYDNVLGEESPRALPAVLPLARAYLLEGRPDKSLNLLDGSEPRILRSPISAHRAGYARVYVQTLVALGRVREIDDFVATVRRDFRLESQLIDYVEQGRTARPGWGSSSPSSLSAQR